MSPLATKCKSRFAGFAGLHPRPPRRPIQFPFDPPTANAVGGFSVLRFPTLKKLNVECRKIAPHTACIRYCTVNSDLQVLA